MSHLVSVFIIIVGLIAGFELDIFCEVDYKTQILNCRFIDGSDRVVNEAA